MPRVKIRFPSPAKGRAYNAVSLEPRVVLDLDFKTAEIFFSLEISGDPVSSFPIPSIPVPKAILRNLGAAIMTSLKENRALIEAALPDTLRSTELVDAIIAGLVEEDTSLR